MEALRYPALFVLFFFGSISCKEHLVGEPVPDSYEQNFISLWQGYRDYYPYFDQKNVNWDSLFVVYGDIINTVSSDPELFATLSDLLFQLNDIHATLRSDFDYFIVESNPTSLNTAILELKYVNDLSKPSENSPFAYGSIGDDIAYLRIDTFRGEKDSFKEIDTILKTLYPRKGLILDLRNNGGGSDINSHIVMSRFTNKKTLIRKIVYRNGPRYSDFSEPIPDYITSEGFYYDKPVVLITDRSIYSAAEDFILGMRQLSTITVLGTLTGGASGNPAVFDLPNGWIYSVSRWQILQPENDALYEGIGLIPDTLVFQTPMDDIFLNDTRIDAAVRLLLRAE